MNPLGLPRGSVRALLTLILVAITGAMLFVPVVEGAHDVRGMFILLTSIAVRDYLASRAAQDVLDGPELPNSVVG